MKCEFNFTKSIKPHDKVKLWNNQIYAVSPLGYLFNLIDGTQITSQEAKYKGRSIRRGDEIIAKRKSVDSEWRWNKKIV